MKETLAIALAALLRVESGGDAAAVGDGGRAVGPYQLWPVAVEEANRIVGRKVWTAADRSNPQMARAITRTLLAHHYRRGVTGAVDLACRHRNPKGNAPAWYRERIRKAVDGLH
jgi:hypothetical protein